MEQWHKHEVLKYLVRVSRHAESGPQLIRNPTRLLFPQFSLELLALVIQVPVDCCLRLRLPPGTRRIEEIFVKFIKKVLSNLYRGLICSEILIFHFKYFGNRAAQVRAAH